MFVLGGSGWHGSGRSYVFILFAERASPPRSLFDDANLSRRLIKRAPTSLIRRCCSLRGGGGPARRGATTKPVNSTNYYELSPFHPSIYRCSRVPGAFLAA